MSLEDSAIAEGEAPEIADETDLPEGITALQAAENPIARLRRWGDPTAMINIAEELTEEQLGTIGMRVVRHYDIDNRSREDWKKQAEDAMKLAMQKAKPKNYPWPKSSNIIYPLMTEAADQFAARAYPAIIANNNVVKGVVFGNDEGVPKIDQNTGQPLIDPNTGQPPIDPQTGKQVWEREPGAKQKRATRIGEHMSWQLLEEQPEWEEETDKLLHVLPIVGCEFRKTYYWPLEGRNMSCRVSASNLVINYWAKSMATAPRLTEELELYPDEIIENQQSGYFLPHDFGIANNAESDEDAPHMFLEQHRRLDLDGDGYGEPYIVTVHKDLQKVVRIIARYDPEEIILSRDESKVVKIPGIEYYTKYDFMPNKEGGIYGQGFGHSLRPINEAVNTTLNMLIDAGHLQNTGGGFIGKGLSMHSGTVRFDPGEYKVVNAAGSTVRDAIVHLDHKGPSAVLFTLLGTLIEAGKSVSSVKDVLTGDVRAQTMSPTVFLALVEQGLKVFTAIYKRIHRSLKAEFNKLYRLNRLYLEEQSSYQRGDEWKKIARADYQRGSGVTPISDPTMVVDVQRMARGQFLMGFANDPMMNGKEIRRRALEAASIDNIDKLLQAEPAPDPMAAAKVAELQLKYIEVKARAIMNMAAAVKYLAEADVKVAEEFGTWAATKLELMRGAIDGLDAESDGSATNGAGGSQGADGGDMGTMAAPPGLQNSPALSQ